MQPPHDAEQQRIGNGLVELPRMSWQHVYTLEDKGPGNICHLADNLAIHQIAQTDKTGCRSCGNRNVVEYLPNAELSLADIHQKRYNQTQSTSVARQSFVACELPVAVIEDMDGQEHLDNALPGRQEIVGLVEQTMAQSGTYQDT